MKALKSALDKLTEEGTGFAEKMGHGLLDAFLAADLLGRYHIRLEAVNAGWQPPPEPLEFSEIATEAMTPEAAIEFFRTKTTMIKMPDFVQLAEKYRQRAFTIAWVEEIELLEASKGLLESFLADDRGLEAFRGELGAMFDRAGVTRLADWHMETVYRTNMQTAYNAGRWDDLMDPEMIEFFPLIEYHAVLDDRTRPTHGAMHGTRLPRDDPWWEVNWPPNGFSCRCGATPISALDDLQAQPPPATTTDDRGQSVAVTADPGFAHNPGTQAGWENTEREVAGRAMENGILIRETPEGFRAERVLTGMRSERVQRLSIPGSIEE